MGRVQLIVPLAGRGGRMLAGGYRGPKYLLMAGDRHVIDWGMESLDTKDCDVVFVVRADDVNNYAVDEILIKKFGGKMNVRCALVVGDTRGAVETVLRGIEQASLDGDDPLVVFCPDIFFAPRFSSTKEIFEHDGHILTFKANSPNYSYVCTGADGRVLRTAEKAVISPDASVGVYAFRNVRVFCEAAQKALESVSGPELFICPLYNRIIAAGGDVRVSPVDVMYVMGTPPEMEFFKSVVFPRFLPRHFILCCDHSGFDTKAMAQEILVPWDPLDCGCYTGRDCDYADFVARAVDARRFYPGAFILAFCRSGQGVNICANKYKGIRSALVSDAVSASAAIRHNAANCFAIPASVCAKDLMDIIQAAKEEVFEGGRHQNRLMEMEAAP